MSYPVETQKWPLDTFFGIDPCDLYPARFPRSPSAPANFVEATLQEVVGQQTASTTPIEMVNAQRPRDRQR